MDVHKQCEFIKKDNNCVCKNCGFSIISNCDTTYKNCNSDTEKAIEYPSLPQMAKNLASAMTNYALDGFRNASEEEQERRLSICKQCPFYDEVQNRCKACGCNSSLKTRIASSDCPKGFWGKV